MKERCARRIPWWLWPNVLGLDAPAIAVVWQILFCHRARIVPTWREQAILFLVVWAIYLSDRVIDGLRLGVRPTSSMRHQLGHEWAAALMTVAGISAVAGLSLAISLPHEVLVAGAGLSCAVAIYFVWNHLAAERFGRGSLKEVTVSLVFALGSALVPLARGNAVEIVAPLGGFIVACYCNCLLIAHLEDGQDRDRGERSIAGTVPGIGTRGLCIAGGLLIACSVWFGVQPSVLILTLAGTGALLLATAVINARRGSQVAAVWADFALLFPGAVGVLYLALP